tara:strand:- start:3451 stop:4806 length:1356 start_codon:yes stop_codon:yes gene_type:complete
MKYLFFGLLGLISLSACVNPLTSFQTNKKVDEAKIYSSNLIPSSNEDVPLHKASLDPRIKNLSGLPLIKSNFLKLKAAKKSIDTIKASQAFKVSSSGNLGIQDTISQKENLAVTTSVVGEKAIYLYSEGKINLDIASTQRDIVKIDISLLIDSTIARLLNLTVLKSHASQFKAISVKYKKEYDENKALLNSAVDAGLVDSGQKFGFYKTLAKIDRQLHDNEAKLSLAELDVRRATEILGPLSFDVNLLDTDKMLALATSPDKVIKFETIKLNKKILENEIQLISSQKQTKASFNTRVTSPTSSDGDWSAFAGVTLSLPIYDAGETDFLIAEKQALLGSLEAEITNLMDKEADNRLQLKKFLVDSQKTISMLQQEKLLSLEIIADLQSKLKIGSASISDIVSETLAMAEQELQVIEIEKNMKIKVLEYASNYGSSCALVGLCSDIYEELYFE